MIFVCETEERILLKKFCEMDDRDLTEKGRRPGNVWRLLSWRGIFRAGFWTAGAAGPGRPGRQAGSGGQRARRADGRGGQKIMFHKLPPSRTGRIADAAIEIKEARMPRLGHPCLPSAVPAAGNEPDETCALTSY